MILWGYIHKKIKMMTEIRKSDFYNFAEIVVFHFKTLKIPKKRQIVRRMSIYYEII
jgi:hypothetical protein